MEVFDAVFLLKDSKVTTQTCSECYPELAGQYLIIFAKSISILTSSASISANHLPNLRFNLCIIYHSNLPQAPD